MISKSFADLGIEVDPDATGNHLTTCPRCSSDRQKSRDKCLSVNVEKGVWLCHHCQWKGGIGGVSKGGQKEYVRPYYQTMSELPGGVVEWFKGRGIPEETLLLAGIGYGKEWMPQSGKEEGAIMFPYFDSDGSVINIKYRTHDKKMKMVKDAELAFYNLVMAQTDTVIIVEGEIDVLSLLVVGYRSVISVPNGAGGTNMGYLDRDWEFLDKAQKVIIAGDNDAPGKKLRDELARRIGREKCWSVTWPAGCKDANDTLVQEGRDALRKCIETAAEFPVAGIHSVSDADADLERLYEGGHTKGSSTGWASLDELFTVAPGLLNIVTGIPGSGKSEWLDNLVIHLAETEGWKCAVYSPENQPISLHIQKLMEKVAGMGMWVNNGHQTMPRDVFEKAKAFVDSHFTFLLPDDEDSHAVDSILALAKVSVKRHGIKVLIIDPYNELDHVRDKNLTETEYISQLLSKLRRFARSYGVAVFLVAHPAKLLKRQDGTYPCPTPYDISGSAHFRNKADGCIAVHRSEFKSQDGTVEVHVQKVRFKWMGKIGMVKLKYDWQSGRMEEL